MTLHLPLLSGLCAQSLGSLLVVDGIVSSSSSAKDLRSVICAALAVRRLFNELSLSRIASSLERRWLARSKLASLTEAENELSVNYGDNHTFPLTHLSNRNPRKHCRERLEAASSLSCAVDFRRRFDIASAGWIVFVRC